MLAEIIPNPAVRQNVRWLYEFRNYPMLSCPLCSQPAARHSSSSRTLFELSRTQPTRIKLLYSRHYCKFCSKFFHPDIADLADPASHYSSKTKDFVLRKILQENFTVPNLRKLLHTQYHLSISPATIYRWLTHHLLSGMEIKIHRKI